MPKAKSIDIIASVVDTFKEPLPLVAMATALVSAILGGIGTKSWGGTVEGFGLLVFLVIVNLIISSFDYIKDSQFSKLQQLLKKEKISAIRGKAFQTRSISVWKLVVGDVVLLETGSRVPADVAIISENGLMIQDPLAPPKDDKKDEAPQEERLPRKVTHRLVKAGSLITAGSAKAIVCVVGKDSTRGVVDRKLNVNLDSPLNEKLDNLANQMMKFALIAAGIIFIELMVFLFINIAAEDNTGEIILAGLPRRVNQAVVLAIVSFPEGLALTF